LGPDVEGEPAEVVPGLGPLRRGEGAPIRIIVGFDVTQLGAHGSSCMHLLRHASGVSPAKTCAKMVMSMFPPDKTIATRLPLTAEGCLSTAAREAAPAPSAMLWVSV